MDSSLTFLPTPPKRVHLTCELVGSTILLDCGFGSQRQIPPVTRMDGHDVLHGAGLQLGSCIRIVAS